VEVVVLEHLLLLLLSLKAVLVVAVVRTHLFNALLLILSVLSQ
jgi:hypothetical protein